MSDEALASPAAAVPEDKAVINRLLIFFALVYIVATIQRTVFEIAGF